MGAFFEKFKGNTATGNGSINVAHTKKEPPPLPLTPLQKMLQDMGPVQDDGTDKFFGMENAQFGNTCYCNSILQCLYYSVPFRESVVNFPRRSSPESLAIALQNNLRYPDPDAPPEDNAKKAPLNNVALKSPGLPPNQPQKPEDKDSPEYKKKMVMSTLPLLETTDNARSYGMQESLFTSLKDIFEAIVACKERTGVIRPYHFMDLLRRQYDMFGPSVHQDAHEFFNVVLNEVMSNVEAEAKRAPLEIDQQSSNTGISSGQITTSESVATAFSNTMLKAQQNSRWVHELFEGILTSETQCLTCENVSQRDEVFLDLSVDLEQHTSVTSCLRKFSEEEMLCERNKFHCDNCGGLQEAEKRMKIKRLPKILALHLKRFKYHEPIQRLQKLFHRVVYPYHLRLFNTTDDADDPDKLYELYAVVVHIGGGPYHGHYVSIIKTKERGWLLFDDEMVEPVDKNYVRNFFGDRPGLACAYLLFYQETTFEAMEEELEKDYAMPARDPVDLNEMAGTPVPPAEMNRARSTLAVPTANSLGLSPVRPVPSAPQLATHPEPAAVPPLSTSPNIPFASFMQKKVDPVAKKEKAKEEKERKAAEKEKEKAEKQQRRERELKLREVQKRQDAELKAALEASKQTKLEEDQKRTPATDKQSNQNGQAGKASGIGKFRIGRTFSQSKILFHREKESMQSESDLPRVPPIPDNAEISSSPAQPQKLNGTVENGTLFPDSTTSSSVSPQRDSHEQHDQPIKRATNKRSRFGLRSKSFNVL